MTCLNKLRRSYPYIRLLHKDIRDNNKKLEILKSLPNFVIHDLIEIVYNILQGNCRVSKKQLSQVQKQKKKASQFYKSIQQSKSKKSREQVLYKQKGGFIGALLPIVSSLIGGLNG